MVATNVPEIDKLYGDLNISNADDAPVEVTVWDKAFFSKIATYSPFKNCKI